MGGELWSSLLKSNLVMPINYLTPNNHFQHERFPVLAKKVILKSQGAEWSNVNVIPIYIFDLQCSNL